MLFPRGHTQCPVLPPGRSVPSTVLRKHPAATHRTEERLSLSCPLPLSFQLDPSVVPASQLQGFVAESSFLSTRISSWLVVTRLSGV